MKKPSKTKALTPSGYRTALLASTVLVGATAGVFAAVGWGQNFRTRSLEVAGLGTFYRISLPTDIRELSDLRTAEIAAPSASDYERVGVNNYWIASSENPSGVVWPLPPDQKDTFDVRQNIVIRNHGGALRSALNAFLPGRNFVVYEMENSGGGYCVGGYDVKLNGESIVGVPLYAPSGPKEILSLLRLEDDTRVRAGFDKVLCSRRVIEVDLGVAAEPLKRIREFVGL